MKTTDHVLSCAMSSTASTVALVALLLCAIVLLVFMWMNTYKPSQSHKPSADVVLEPWCRAVTHDNDSTDTPVRLSADPPQDDEDGSLARDALGRLLPVDPRHRRVEWHHVGTLTSGTSASSVRTVPLFAAKHPTEHRRYVYRVRWRDLAGSEAWVQLGDRDDDLFGIEWLRHGTTVQLFETVWVVGLDRQWY